MKEETAHFRTMKFSMIVMNWAYSYIDSLKSIFNDLKFEFAPGCVLFVKDFVNAKYFEDSKVYGNPKDFYKIDQDVKQLSFRKCFEYNYTLADDLVRVAVY